MYKFIREEVSLYGTPKEELGPANSTSRSVFNTQPLLPDQVSSKTNFLHKNNVAKENLFDA